MSAYRPERPRSPSPHYRDRRYSPSRAVSRSPPPPPRRRDDYLHRSPSPPPRRYDHGPSRPYDDRRYDPPPPRPYDDRGYDEPMRRYTPPPRRYGSPGPRRSPSPRRRSISPPPRRRADDVEPYRPIPVDRYRPLERYDDRPPTGGMAADREETWNRQAPSRGGDYSGGQWERGRDVDELYETPASGNEHAGPSRTAPSAPSRDVIMLGLDPRLSEEDLQAYLENEHDAVIESTTIPRKYGESKFFGFARFATLEAATDFVDQNWPTVVMPALDDYSEPRKVRIDFAQTPTPSGGRPSAQGQTPAITVRDGMWDVGSAGGGNRVLLLRQLDPETYANEIIRRLSQEIARMVGKPGQDAEAEKCITRVVMIVEKQGRQPWGLAFVELVTPELALSLLSFLISPVHQPTGFSISGAYVAASFAKFESFVPQSVGLLGGHLIIRSTRSGGIGSATIDEPDGAWCGYWDQQAGAEETVPRSRSPIPEDGSAPEIPDTMRYFLGPLAGPPKAPTVGQTSAASGAAQVGLLQAGMQPIKIGNIGGSGIVKVAKKVESEGFLGPIGKNILGDDDEGEDMVGKDTVLLSRTKGAHIVPQLSGSRKTAKNISKWNTKQSELAAPVPARPPNAPPAGISDANSVIGVRKPPSKAPTNTPSDTPGSAPKPTPPALPASSTPSSDLDFTGSTGGKPTCLLCQRQFKSEDQLRKHVAQSDLHKTNLRDPALCEAAKRRKTTSGTSPVPTDAPKYRDRAAERREAFNQPAIPLPEDTSQIGQKRKFVEPPSLVAPAPPPPPPPALEPGKDETNRGNQLLAKMGWTSGTGLGSGGEGRVDPVMVQQFEMRAGLGASKGQDPTQRQAQNPGQRALDLAKERYNSR